MTQTSEDLSVAKLFAEREERRRRDREVAERFQHRKEEELAAHRQRLENVHLAEEMIPTQLERLKHAFERGESELMVASFPVTMIPLLCWTATDRSPSAWTTVPAAFSSSPRSASS